MSKLSAIIITLNEEENIEAVINSAIPIADEIIVLDSFSTDNTVKIAQSLGAKVVQKEWQGYSQSKNYANSLANFQYILSLDADEVINAELSQAIQVEKNKGFNGIYSVNRLTNYCGSWIHHSGWYPDKKVRIFPKKGSKWQGAFVHEELVFSENFTQNHLHGDLLHYSYTNAQEHKERADKYSVLTAQKMFANGKKASVLKPYLSAFAKFISMYVFNQGFLDGAAGFNIARISAKSNIVKYKTLLQLQETTKNKTND